MTNSSGVSESQLTTQDSVTLDDFVRIVTANGGASRKATLTTIKTLLLTQGSNQVLNVKSVAAGTYQILSSDSTVLIDTVSASLATTLPDATLNTGLVLTVKKVDNANTVTVQTLLSQTIDGATTYVLGAAAKDFVTVVSDGTEWHVIGS
jgi:hypothetical protein